MNLPVLGLMLKDVPLNILLRAQRVVTLVNDSLPEGIEGINVNMNGFALNKWYKNLPYPVQDAVSKVIIYTDYDKDFIITQIENASYNSYKNGEIKEDKFKMFAGMISTLFLMISIAMSVMYNISAEQMGVGIPSPWMFSIIDFVSKVIMSIAGL